MRHCSPSRSKLAGQGKRLVILSLRGDYGYHCSRLAHRNQVERSIATAFAYIGIDEVHSVAIEYDEFGGARLADSIAAAEQAVDEWVDRLARETRGAADDSIPECSPLAV
jgi:FMN-dependent NADH-azoreductase